MAPPRRQGSVALRAGVQRSTLGSDWGAAVLASKPCSRVALAQREVLLALTALELGPDRPVDFRVSPASSRPKPRHAGHREGRPGESRVKVIEGDASVIPTQPERSPSASVALDLGHGRDCVGRTARIFSAVLALMTTPRSFAVLTAPVDTPAQRAISV